MKKLLIFLGNVIVNDYLCKHFRIFYDVKGHLGVDWI